MLTLGRSLDDLGHSVRYAGFRGRGFREAMMESERTALEFPMRWKVDPWGVGVLGRWLRQERPDVLHAHLSSACVNGGLAARLAGVPSVATVHGMSGKLSFATVDHLIAVSAAVKSHLVGQGVAAERVSVVPNGVRVAGMPGSGERFSAREELGLGPDDLVVGTSARLTAEKGLDWAIRAFAAVVQELPGGKFVIFGDGPERGRLETLARHLGMDRAVQFMGFRTDVRRLLPGLDVFVFPTLKEAMGIAVVEAMAAGLPVVASDTGGVPEVVSQETGVLVRPFDEAGLARELTGLLRSRDSRMLFGAAGYRRAKSEFSQPVMAERTLGIYQELLARRRRG